MGVHAERVSAAADGLGSSPVCDKPVDLVHLARYTLGSRSLEREVLALFQTQSIIYLNRLKQAMNEKSWHDAAHTIKGSAKGIGAWQVVASAEAAECIRGKIPAKKRKSVVAALEDEIQEANSYISSLLVDV